MNLAPDKSRALRMAEFWRHKSVMLWFKALHVVAMVTWFAGLFYLPRLFVYHAMASDAPSLTRFCTMERKLYRGIMNPGAWLTTLLGVRLAVGLGREGFALAHWLHLKLVFVAMCVAYHLYCGVLMRRFARGENDKGHVWYRVFNEVPVLFLFAIVILAIVKPL